MQYEGEVSDENEVAEDPKNYSTKDNDVKSMYHEVPDIFRNVKDIPSVFTINSFDFTKPDMDETNCECIVDKNEIRKNSKFTFDFYDDGSHLSQTDTRCWWLMLGTIWVGAKFGMLMTSHVTDIKS